MSGDDTAQMGSHTGGTDDHFATILFRIGGKFCGLMRRAVGGHDPGGKRHIEFIQYIKGITFQYAFCTQEAVDKLIKIA